MESHGTLRKVEDATAQILDWTGCYTPDVNPFETHGWPRLMA